MGCLGRTGRSIELFIELGCVALEEQASRSERHLLRQLWPVVASCVRNDSFGVGVWVFQMGGWKMIHGNLPFEDGEYAWRGRWMAISRGRDRKEDYLAHEVTKS